MNFHFVSLVNCTTLQVKSQINKAPSLTIETGSEKEFFYLSLDGSPLGIALPENNNLKVFSSASPVVSSPFTY